MVSKNVKNKHINTSKTVTEAIFNSFNIQCISVSESARAVCMNKNVF